MERTRTSVSYLIVIGHHNRQIADRLQCLRINGGGRRERRWLPVGHRDRRCSLYGRELAAVFGEHQASRWFLFLIANANDAGQTVLFERPKSQAQLFVGLENGLQIARLQIHVDRIAVDHLDLLGLGDLGEVLLHLERLVLLVVRDAEDANERLVRIVPFREDNETRHVRHGRRLTVDLVGEFNDVSDALSID